MGNDVIRVLLVEDDADQAGLVRRTLQKQTPAFDVTVVGDGVACLAAVSVASYSVVLLDYGLPGMSGLEVLGELHRRGVSSLVVMVTGQGDERVAVEAVKAGAADYILKTSGYLTTLPIVIAKVLKQHDLARENARLYDEAQQALADLKVAQEQLVRSATLRALGELAAGAAHHLNNLLAVILGRVELLLRTDEPGQMRQQTLHIIHKAATDAAEVVRRVQQFARMPAPEQRTVDLHQIAADVLEMTRSRWEDAVQVQALTVEATLEGTAVAPVRGHPAALREVVTNLVLNAVDAMPSGGRVTLRTAEADGWVSLTVADTGIGMTEQVRRRCLEPFFTTKGMRSTGLGLSVNYGIIKQHGGDLDIESTEGVGTVVTIRLPVWDAQMEKRSSEGLPTAAVPPGSPRRILMIDDDDSVREVLVDMLVADGHTVFAARRGREGLALLDRGERVDLVVTDLGMPEMTGWEVARAIYSRWPRLPVVLLTGWGDTLNVGEVQREAVALIVSKPVTAEALARLVAVCDSGPRAAEGVNGLLVPGLDPTAPQCARKLETPSIDGQQTAMLPELPGVTVR